MQEERKAGQLASMGGAWEAVGGGWPLAVTTEQSYAYTARQLSEVTSQSFETILASLGDYLVIAKTLNFPDHES